MRVLDLPESLTWEIGQRMLLLNIVFTCAIDIDGKK